jgi:hypothetical protein
MPVTRLGTLVFESPRQNKMPAVEGNADGGGKGVLKRLIICTVGIILSFGAWGYLLESLTSGGKRMSETGTILMNGIMFTCVARAVMAMNGKRRGETYTGFRGFTRTPWASSYAPPYRVYGVL